MKNDVGCICGTTAFPAFHYPPCTALPQGAMTPPDSDAREVSTAGCAHKPDWLTCELCNPQALSVSLPLSLAQRILDALEVAGELQHSFRPLAAELRAVIGK